MIVSNGCSQNENTRLNCELARLKTPAASKSKKRACPDDYAKLVCANKTLTEEVRALNGKLAARVDETRMGQEFSQKEKEYKLDIERLQTKLKEQAMLLENNRAANDKQRKELKEATDRLKAMEGSETVEQSNEVKSVMILTATRL